MKLSQATKAGAGALIAAGVAGMLGMASAQAATNTSSTDSSSLIDDFVLQYKNELRGPSLTNPIKAKQPGDFAQNSGSNIEMKNYLTLGYEMNDEVRLDGVAYWRWQPVAEHKFTMRDPYLRLRDTNFAKIGDVSIYADARLLFPAYENSRKQDMIGGLASLQVASYTIPNSRFTVGMTFFEQYNVFSSNSVAQANDGYFLELYGSPSVEYRISPTLAATGLYEAGGLHMVGKSFGLTNTYSDIQLGVSWDPSPRVNVAPYLELKTHGKVTMDTTQIGAALNFSIL